MKKLTPLQAREKILRYCVYQERCHSEVRDKLYSFGLFKTDVEELITYLITEGFLNEERFAKAFAGGKFRMKKWGRLKIVHELEQKHISKNCIKSALKEIDERDYTQTLEKLVKDKSNSLDEPNLFVRRDKLSKYVIQKGYEPDLVWSLIKELFPH
ncbi:regulatory protein RecX [Chryseosolibacter indicus]|uniref:Regulatory protein RecX n=1 Tax=Chryseosolibacter indicus TaxID=2782351 RepID=A0ABS5VW18_9BACT|nr:RecX family transcriptional regulator [Chryseosolibacter indicus]MBT1704191.1 RecX family transcriptional regulator [Chryseosolibacter indicus]